ALVPNLGMLVVEPDLEGHEVAEIAPSCLLQLGEDAFRRAHQPEVDVLGGPRSLEPDLENEAALEHGRIADDSDDPSQEPIEDEKLTPARELDSGLGRRAQSLLECLLEGFRRGVGPDHQGVTPPKGARALLTSARSLSTRSPRRRAC